MLNVTSIPSQMPLWHRAGGLLILASQSELRVDEQDWSQLVLEIHMPTFEYWSRGRQTPMTTTRTVFERETGARTEIEMTMRAGVANGTLIVVGLQIGQAEDGANRAWTVRLHMPPLASVVSATTDGSAIQEFTTLEPIASEHIDEFLPFGGVGSRPASGRVAEVELEASRLPRTAELLVEPTWGSRR